MNKSPKCSCGETEPDKFYRRKDGAWRYRCRKCDTKALVLHFQEQKRKAVAYKGGKCEECGYDKCQAALDFHHIVPSIKDPNWNNLKNRKFENIKEELDKCRLLCCRCHKEIHYT